MSGEEEDQNRSPGSEVAIQLHWLRWNQSYSNEFSYFINKSQIPWYPAPPWYRTAAGKHPQGVIIWSARERRNQESYKYDNTGVSENLYNLDYCITHCKTIVVLRVKWEENTGRRKSPQWQCHQTSTSRKEGFPVREKTNYENLKYLIKFKMFQKVGSKKVKPLKQSLKMILMWRNIWRRTRNWTMTDRRRQESK